MNDTIVEYLYVVAILFFIISLKWLSEVKTSRYGNGAESLCLIGPFGKRE